MLRKVKTQEELLELFNDEGYATNYVDESTDFVTIKNNHEFIFTSEMFQFCGRNIEISPEHNDPVPYDFLGVNGFYWLEDWLVPEGDGSVEKKLANRLAFVQASLKEASHTISDRIIGEDDEAMDGDETELIAKMFLVFLDHTNGNITDREAERKMGRLESKAAIYFPEDKKGG